MTAVVTVEDLEKGVSAVSSQTQFGGLAMLFKDEGSVITAEDEAMLQALYSRSKKSAKNHIRRVLEVGSGKFMGSYYLGYGHKSIADCGSATVYIEGVSMLAAKAIQNNQLYNGQERSTRYIDFGAVPFINPLLSSGETERQEGDEILEGWRSLYREAYPAVQNQLFNEHPNEGVSDAVYTRAVSARAFDICRGFLPAGCSTGLSWHSELSVFGEQLPKLKVHPLCEVREIACAIELVLAHTFKNSFPVKYSDALERYYSGISHEMYHHDPACGVFNIADNDLGQRFSEPIKKVRYCPLPEVYKEGHMLLCFLLDYGSYRDLARHRSVFQRLPLLTKDIGIHPWYLANLERVPMVRDAVIRMSEKTVCFLDRCLGEKVSAQYFIPMMYQVSCKVSGNLYALGYITELRSSSKVHPTLVDLMYNHVRKAIYPYVVVDIKGDPFRFNPGRGRDTVKRKNSLKKSGARN